MTKREFEVRLEAVDPADRRHAALLIDGGDFGFCRLRR